MNTNKWVFVDSLPFASIYDYSYRGPLFPYGENMVAYLMGASPTSVDTFELFGDTIENDANGYLIIHDTTAHNYYFKKLTKEGGGGVGFSATYRNNMVFSSAHHDYVMADSIMFFAPPLANFYGDQQAVLLYLDWDETYVGLETKEVDESPVVFPNPVDETLHIFLDAEYTFSIRDVLGRVVVSGNGTGLTTVSTSVLAVGCYYLELDSGSGTYIKKVIKQ